MGQEKDWSGNKKSIYVTLGASNHSNHEREVNDYYATDPKAIDGLIQLDVLDIDIPVWEPACGEGHLSNKLIKKGFIVHSSDLIDRGFKDSQIIDFLNININFKIKKSCNIVTNPPYKFAQEFIEKSLELTEPGSIICMFLKLQFLESQKRRKMFDNNPPKIVAVYSKRIKCAINGDFENTGSSAVAYAWFIWENGFKGESKIKWI